MPVVADSPCRKPDASRQPLLPERQQVPQARTRDVSAAPNRAKRYISRCRTNARGSATTSRHNENGLARYSGFTTDACYSGFTTDAKSEIVWSLISPSPCCVGPRERFHLHRRRAALTCARPMPAARHRYRYRGPHPPLSAAKHAAWHSISNGKHPSVSKPATPNTHSLNRSPLSPPRHTLLIRLGPLKRAPGQQQAARLREPCESQPRQAWVLKPVCRSTEPQASRPRNCETGHRDGGMLMASARQTLRSAHHT